MEIFSKAFFRDVSTLDITEAKCCYCVGGAFCVLELAKTNFVTLVQRHFRRRYGKPPPTRQSIYDWSKKFGCLCKGNSSGRPPVSEETVELDYRIDICRVTKGLHIDHLLLRHINLKTCTTKPRKRKR